MLFRLLADAVLVVHLAFVLFVGLGALLALRWPRVLWLQVPALAWGVFVEVSGTICPLTGLENYFRGFAGEAGYAGGCIAHYLSAVIYPEGLTRELQWILAALVLALNGAVYLVLYSKRKATFE